MKNSLLFLSVLAIIVTACSDNNLNVDPFGPRGSVTGSWLPLADGDTLEIYVRVDTTIHLGDPAYDLTIVPEADPETFQVWTDSYYARDSAYVYFPIEVECILLNEDERVCYSTNYIVEGAAAASFRYLGNGYGTDGNSVFNNGILLEGSDGEGF